MATTVGRRERKKLVTRRDLEESALRLFLERGFERTTIHDITEAADVAPRTFFRHFPSKEDVVFADTDAYLDRFRQALAGRGESEPILRSVREALLSLADDHSVRRDTHLLRVRLAEQSPAVAARAREHQAAWEDAVADFVAGRLGVDPVRDPRPRMVAGATIATLRAAMDAWAAGGGRQDLVTFFVDAFSLLNQGFGVRRPRR